MRPAEDVLDRAFVHLHPRCHQSGIPVQYPEHGQNGHVSDVEETQLSLNLVQRQERFTFHFDLDHSLLLGPQLVNELFSGGVRVQDPLSDGFCLLLRQLVRVRAFFEFATKTRYTRRQFPYFLNIFN